jgi:hypothetical protein
VIIQLEILAVAFSLAMYRLAYSVANLVCHSWLQVIDNHVE